MPGNLTKYLQQEFSLRHPKGWVCHQESRLLSKQLEDLLGYSPRADVVLERSDGLQRIWIEFEVSRADPVANHAKFATSHLFQPQPRTDAFVAMVSPHVARGRRNLGSLTISLMRHIGMRAFQTVLFPRLSGEQIKRLNHTEANTLVQAGLRIEDEIDRALSVCEPVLSIPGQRIHFAGDPFEVMMNARQWNKELATTELRQLWGRRTITYFVFNPASMEFAPSKFCAYVPVAEGTREGFSLESSRSLCVMTVRLYITLDGIESRFDGNKARVHLQENLAFTSGRLGEDRKIQDLFHRWVRQHEVSVVVHPDGPVILMPPCWFC